jgi:DNA-binding transcriptional LysR family regulator
MRKLDDLIIFTRVVERGSFIAAARQLGLPAATVSRKVQDLEARLGIELLRPTTRRIFVTDAGRSVYDRAARGLALIDEAESIAKCHQGKPAGILRVLSPYTLGMLVAGPLLQSFQTLHPEVQVYLTLNNDHLDLVEHRFDLALWVGTSKDSAYKVRRLFHGRRVMVAAPSYLESAPKIAGVADLPQHHFLSASIDIPATGAAYSFVRGREESTVDLVPRFVSNEVSVILDRVLNGAGFAILRFVLCRAISNPAPCRRCSRTGNWPGILKCRSSSALMPRPIPKSGCSSISSPR